MKTTSICSLIILGLSAGALADEKGAPPAGAPAAGAMDMTKVGPMSRKVTKEDKKGVDELYKTTEEAWKKGDLATLVDQIDFPVIMLSDDSKGQVQHFAATRDQWTAMMKPMLDNMPKEKDMKMKMKHTAHFLSDDLAVVVEETSMTMGKIKGSWKGFSVVTLKDGKWKIKQMAEAGWGDMKPPPAAKTTASAEPIRK
jgi:hypothetical protein